MECISPSLNTPPVKVWVENDSRLNVSRQLLLAPFLNMNHPLSGNHSSYAAPDDKNETFLSPLYYFTINYYLHFISTVWPCSFSPTVWDTCHVSHTYCSSSTSDPYYSFIPLCVLSALCPKTNSHPNTPIWHVYLSAFTQYKVHHPSKPRASSLLFLIQVQSIPIILTLILVIT